jgi:hypothetical protein
MTTWQTKSVQIESADLQWDGSEESLNVIRDFVPAVYLEYGEIETMPSVPFMRVYNTLEEQWLNVPLGHWVVKGLKGEFYPCEAEAMDLKYFEVQEESEGIGLVDLINYLRSEGKCLAGSEYIKDSDMVDMGESLIAIADTLENYGVR